MDVIGRLTLKERLRCVESSQSIVEEIAAQHANIACHDLARQLEPQPGQEARAFSGIPSGHLGGDEFEFEPASYQPGFQSVIPNEILLDVLQHPERSELPLKQGYLIDNIVYFIVGNKLYLWNPGRTEFGLQRQAERRSLSSSTSTYAVRQFSHPISEVCFVENHRNNFKPLLVVATTRQIQVLGFKLLDKSILSQTGDTIQHARSNYDLTRLVDTGTQPEQLEIDESVSHFIQCKKTGRIFFSSNSSTFVNPQIKELNLNASPEGLARVSSLFSLFGMTSAAHEHKRLKCGAPADAGTWSLFSSIRQAIPDFFNMFADWKRVDDIKIDEQRNILYVLSSQVTNRGVELGSADIDVYDLGMLGNGFRKVATIDNAAFCG